MFTIEYKGHYVQGYCDRPHVYVIVCGSLQWFKSLLAAKRFINKHCVPETVTAAYGLDE